MAFSLFSLFFGMNILLFHTGVTGFGQRMSLWRVFRPNISKFIVSSERGYILPKDVYLPLDRFVSCNVRIQNVHEFKTITFKFQFAIRLDFQYARSSGPGGQNVNKLNTKAEVRFHVASADWLDQDVRERLAQYQSNKISKEGELIITSQEHR